MAAISNSSPLLRFATTGRLALLGELFGEVVVPPAVWTEIVVRGADRPGSQAIAQLSWLRQQSPLKDDTLEGLLDVIDEGEAEAIALAYQHAEPLPILLDDRKGRRAARSLGLTVVGSAGVLLLAKDTGLIERVRPILDDLRVAGLYLDDNVSRHIIDLAGETTP